MIVSLSYGFSFAETVYGRIKIRCSYRSRHVTLYLEHSECNRKSHPFAIKVGIWVQRRTSSWNRASSHRCTLTITDDRNEDTPLHDDVRVLKISDHTLSDDKTSFLTITDTKWGWHTEAVSAVEADMLSLR